MKYAYDILTGKSAQVPASKRLANITVTTAEASNPTYAKYFYSAHLSH